jgi:hypothetical protein
MKKPGFVPGFFVFEELPGSVWIRRCLAPAILLVLPACMVTPAGAVSDDRQFSRIRTSGTIENDRLTKAGGLASPLPRYSHGNPHSSILATTLKRKRLHSRKMAARFS